MCSFVKIILDSQLLTRFFKIDAKDTLQPKQLSEMVEETSRGLTK